MSEMGISRAGLAKLAKCSKGAITDMFNPESQRSMLVPAIHKVLGWAQPMGPLLSSDDEEILKLVRRMDPRDRAALVERALVLEEQRKRK